MELNITSFLNHMVVLVPFLLVTAVFSRMAVVELNLPSSTSGPASRPAFRLEIIVRELGIEISERHGRSLRRIQKIDGEYDLATLADVHAVAQAGSYPEEEARRCSSSRRSRTTICSVMDGCAVAEDAG